MFLLAIYHDGSAAILMRLGRDSPALTCMCGQSSLVNRRVFIKGHDINR